MFTVFAIGILVGLIITFVMVKFSTEPDPEDHPPFQEKKEPIDPEDIGQDHTYDWRGNKSSHLNNSNENKTA